MRSAPAVHYPVGHSRFLVAACITVWLSGLALSAWWVQLDGYPAWRIPVVLAVLGISGSMAFLSLHNLPVGTLRWDGQAWHWQATGQTSVLALHHMLVEIDLQFGMVVRWTTEAGTGRWAWVGRRSMPSRWLALRRALCANETADTALQTPLGLAAARGAAK